MKLRLIAVVVLAAAAMAGIAALLLNIAERKREAKTHYLELVKLTDDTIDPVEWGKNFPRQYDGYRRTVDTQRTRHGGSEAFQKLDEDPRWRRIFKGYAFGLDYREERGHAYMLSDQDETRR
ncbi:MAG: ammonia-forming cytochrome c nitrite reductase subunit c552, partial [Solirubrobacterales bacterium]